MPVDCAPHQDSDLNRERGDIPGSLCREGNDWPVSRATVHVPDELRVNREQWRALSDHTGYDFWLTKLNQFNGNYINAEMVKAFITSIEYRQRFGP